MRTDLLQHLLNYMDIYEYVAADKKSGTDIKEYLIREKNVSETSARRYVKLIASDSPGMFLVEKNMIAINKPLAKEVISEIITLLGVKVDDMSEDAIARKDDEIEKLQKQLDRQNAEKQKILNELEKEREGSKQKDAIIQESDRKFKNLVKAQITEPLNRDVVFAGDFEMLPKPTMEEELFLDDSIVSLDLEKSISKYGGKRNSFYSVTEDETEKMDMDKNSQPGQELNSRNYFLRIARAIMTTPFFEKWAKEMQEEKAFQKKNGIEPQASEAKLKAMEKANQGKSEMEVHAEELIRKRKISIQTLLNDDRMTDQMRLQLYARFCQYRGTEMEPLINFAADYGINSKWFIQVLEDPDSCGSYENIRDYLRIFSKPSEYRMRLDFARELLDGTWHIKLDYDGAPTLFALVPVKEINEIRERLLLPPSKFTCKDLISEKTEENGKMAAGQDARGKGLKTGHAERIPIVKPDFVETFKLNEDEPYIDAEDYLLDANVIDYTDYQGTE